MSASQVVLEVELPGIQLFRRGKVRDVFDVGDHLLVVSTDRISAFDVVLPQGIPGKGAVLTELSRFWFDRLGSIVPHHLVSTDVDDYPAILQPHRELLAGRSMLCKKAQVIPFECVVRGYIVGTGFKDYQRTGAVCGHQLPDGLQLADRLPSPLFTPSTKAEVGHDMNVSRSHLADELGRELAERLEQVSLELYTTAADHALEHGIIIADTKFELGTVDGELTLIDEVLTPDSSRFWPAAEYRAGISPPSFDKQFVRDYLDKQAWDKTPPAPALPSEIIDGTTARYREIVDILMR